MRDSNSSENVLLALLNFTFRRAFLSRRCLEAPARSAHAYQAEGDLRRRTRSVLWVMESNSSLQVLLWKKKPTCLLREEELGEWAKGCGVSFTLALVSIHWELLRLIQLPASPPHQEHLQAPAQITNAYQTSPCKRHFSVSASGAGWRARAWPCPGKGAQQRAGIEWSGAPALPAWPLFSLWKNTENEIPLLCEGLSNLMTKGSIQSWKLLLFFSGGIQSRTGWRFSSKWG